MTYPHLPRARMVNGHLMSEPPLDPPEDPPEEDPVDDYDDFDDFDDRYPDYDDEWSRVI